MSLSDTLKEKAGPLPVWAWGAILGLVVIGGMYWYSSRSSAGGASTDTGTALAYPELQGDSTLTAATVTSADPSSDMPDFSSNLAWETYVLARLVALGYSPLTVQAALENYLHGDPLTPEQQTIVNLAVTKYGLPPNGTTGISVPAVGVDTSTGKPVPVTKVSSSTKAVADIYNSGTGVSAGTTTTTGSTYSNGSTVTDRTLQISPAAAAAGGTTSTKSVTVWVNGVPYYVNYRNGQLSGDPFKGHSATVVFSMKQQLTALGLPTTVTT